MLCYSIPVRCERDDQQSDALSAAGVNVVGTQAQHGAACSPAPLSTVGRLERRDHILSVAALLQAFSTGPQGGCGQYYSFTSPTYLTYHHFSETVLGGVKTRT